MKKKIYIIIILISINILLFISGKVYIGALSLVPTLAFSLLVIANIKYKRYMGKKVPNIMKNLKRNYESLILGLNNKDNNLEIYNKEKSLDLTNYKRNLYTDILILKRWYSFLDSNGTVYFNIDFKNKYYLLSQNISVFDDEFLHQVTLFEHGKEIDTRRYKIEKIMKSIIFLFVKSFTYNKSNKISNDEIKLIKENIIEIKDFCNERNIKFKINYINISDDILYKINN